MNDEQIVKYVKDMIINNLAQKDYWEEIFIIKDDKSNKILISHIDGLIELFTKAEEILEKGGKNEKSKN